MSSLKIHSLILIPHLSRLHSHSLQKAAVAFLSAEPYVTVKGYLIEIQKGIIQTVVCFLTAAGYIGRHAVGIDILQNTDPLIALLHIVAIHKFICQNRIVNPLFNLIIINSGPFGSKLCLFSQKRHKISCKGFCPSLCLSSHNLA